MIVSSYTNDGSLLTVSSSKSLKNMTGNITKTPDMTYDNRQSRPDEEDGHYDDTALPERNMGKIGLEYVIYATCIRLFQNNVYIAISFKVYNK